MRGNGETTRSGESNTNSAARRRDFLKAVGGVGVAGTATGYLGVRQERDNFKLGVVTSLSGDLRFGGQVTRRGYELWKQAVNEQGGIEVGDSSHQVELVYADAKSNPSTGADAASQMISQQNVDAVLGPYSSNVTLAVVPIMEKNQMPHITGSAESPQIWEQQPQYTFGTIPTVSIIADRAASNILGLDPQAESVYITGVNEPFSKSTAEAMRTAAKNADVEILGYELFPRGTDYTNVVTQGKNAGPDLHLHGGHIGSHVNLVNAAKQLDYSPNGMMFHYGVNTDSFKDGAGDGAAYAFGATVWLPQVERAGGTLFETPQAYVEASQSEFDTAPDYTPAAVDPAWV
jgi:branched-chain amino acid transport system substrate-binding protein